MASPYARDSGRPAVVWHILPPVPRSFWAEFQESRLYVSDSQVLNKIVLWATETEELAIRGTSWNHLGTFSTRLPNMLHLTYLKFFGCTLGDYGVTRIAAGLVGHPSINTLIFDFAHCGDKGATAIADLLCNPSCKISHLYIANNEISSVGAASLAIMFGINKTLVHFDVRENPIGPSGIKAITTTLGHHNSTLRSLLLPLTSDLPTSEKDDIVAFYRVHPSIVPLCWYDRPGSGHSVEIDRIRSLKTANRSTWKRSLFARLADAPFWYMFHRRQTIKMPFHP